MKFSSSRKIQGRPWAALPIIKPSALVSRRTSSDFSGVVRSPFAITGIDRQSLMRATVSYSASPLIVARACAAMYNERLYSGVLGDPCNQRSVSVLLVPPGAHLQCNGYVDSSDHGRSEFQATSFSSFISAEPASFLQTFFAGTAHVDIDNLGTTIDHSLSSRRELGGFGAGNLHSDRFGIQVEVKTVPRFGRLPQARISGGHFRRGHACAELPATQFSERFVRCTPAIGARTNGLASSNGPILSLLESHPSLHSQARTVCAGSRRLV